jgi:DNA-binding transcriptional LysR family regulator
VARRGSVRKAAVTLHLTAAAVNQQILNLEAQVGVPLFDRLPRGMQLTTAGELVLAAVRRSQRDFDNALAQVEDLRALRRGHVRVGVSHATAEYLLPLVIASLHGRYPGITFSVRSGTGEELLRGVAQGEIDVAYCLRRPPPPGVQEVRVAGSTALGFLVPDNVAEDVAAGRLLWRPLHDAGAQLPGCLYQRIGYTRAAAMRLFLDELERVADAMRAGFETGVSWSLKDLAT